MYVTILENQSNITNHKILLGSLEMFWKTSKQNLAIMLGLDFSMDHNLLTGPTSQMTASSSLSQTRVFLQQLVAGPEASGFSFWEQSSETCFSKELVNLFLLSFRKKWKFQNNPTPLRHIYQPKDKGSNMQLMMVLSGANNSGKMLPEVCEVTWKRKYLLSNLSVKIWPWTTAQ